MDWVEVWVHSKWAFLCVRDWIEVWVHSSFFPEFGILENISIKRQKVSVSLMAGWKSVNFQMQSFLKGSVYFRETFRIGALVEWEVPRGQSFYPFTQTASEYTVLPHSHSVLLRGKEWGLPFLIEVLSRKIYVWIHLH